VLLALGLVLLLARQRAFFVRHREALITSFIMQMTWTVIHLGDCPASSSSSSSSSSCVGSSGGGKQLPASCQRGWCRQPAAA
jgi:hypothetical protein